jgi:hypothetical protein
MKLPGFLQRIVAAPGPTPEQQAADQKRMQECLDKVAAILVEYGYELDTVAQIQIVIKAK